METPDFKSELKRLKIALESNEEVFEVIRKHWGRILWPTAGLITFIVITITAFLFIVFFVGATPNTVATFVMILTMLYVTLIAYGISEWFSYKQSALVITNQRILDILQVNFLSRRIQTIDIHEVQSCSGDLIGGIGTLLSYGNILIHTLGDKPVPIHFVPLPETVSNQVMHYHNLVAHGGVDDAHNQSAQKKDEDATPQLEAIPKQAEIIAEQTLPSQPPLKAMPPIGQSQPLLQQTKKTASLLTFHIPSETLTDVLKDLPAQREPTATYLKKTDFFEIQTVVDTALVEMIVEQIKEKGAVDIVASEVDLLD